MNMEGIEILSEKIIYGPHLLGIILIICSFFAAFVFLGCYVSGIFEEWAAGVIIFFLIFAIISIFLSFSNSPTYLNYPDKIQYEIEIIDDNAWKELGPNYNVINKPYETKEIYLIEGDYKND